MNRWISFIALLAAAFLGYAVLNQSADVEMDRATAPAQPGWYLEDAVMIETQPTGAPRVKIAAELIEQDPQQNSISMHEVKVDYFGAEPRHWQLTANRGEVPANTRTIRFSGNVEVAEIGPRNAPRILTEELTLNTQKDVAMSDAPVQVVFGNHSLTARGLSADLNEQTLQLESDVHGRFEPTK